MEDEQPLEKMHVKDITRPLNEKAPLPFFTILVCVVALVLFRQLAHETEVLAWEAISNLGYLSASEVWSGKYWGLITSSFAHLTNWELVFCVGWTAFLGSRIERAAGAGVWAGLFVVSALTTAGMQLQIAGDTRNGFVGPVYGALGFMFVMRHEYAAAWKISLSSLAGIFAISLLAIMTWAGVDMLFLVNIPHVLGFIVGVAFANAIALRHKRNLWLGVMALAVGTAVIPTFYAPWSAQWIGSRALVAAAQGDMAQASGLADEVVRRHGDSVLSYLYRGKVRLQAGQNKEALKDFEKAISLRKDAAEAFMLAGLAKYYLHQYDDAVEFLISAVELERDNPEYRQIRAMGQFALGEYAMAMQDFDEALRLNNSDGSAWLGRALVTRRFMQKKIGTSELNTAMKIFDRRIKNGEQGAELFYLRGRTQLALGNNKDAVTLAGKAIAANGRQARYFDLRGWSRIHAGDHLEALADFNQALKMDPENDSALLGGGIAYFARGEMVKASALLDAALEVNPRLAEGHYFRGKVHAAARDFESAIASYKTAVIINPNLSSAYRARSEAYSALKDTKSAANDLEQAGEVIIPAEEFLP